MGAAYRCDHRDGPGRGCCRDAEVPESAILFAIAPGVDGLYLVDVIARSGIELSGMRNALDLLLGRSGYKHFRVPASFSPLPYRVSALANGRRLEDWILGLYCFPASSTRRIGILASSSVALRSEQTHAGAITIVLRNGFLVTVVPTSGEHGFQAELKEHDLTLSVAGQLPRHIRFDRHLRGHRHDKEMNADTLVRESRIDGEIAAGRHNLADSPDPSPGDRQTIRDSGFRPHHGSETEYRVPRATLPGETFEPADGSARRSRGRHETRQQARCHRPVPDVLLRGTRATLAICGGPASVTFGNRLRVEFPRHRAPAPLGHVRRLRHLEHVTLSPL